MRPGVPFATGLRRLSEGVCPRRTIVVKADEATYRISDVDVTAKGCTLTMITSPAE